MWLDFSSNVILGKNLMVSSMNNIWYKDELVYTIEIMSSQLMFFDDVWPTLFYYYNLKSTWDLMK